MQIAKALNAAHHEEVVHRDLKADNILLVDLYGERDFVKVVDFGIAMVRGSRSSEPRPGFVTGTPEYMSPEQATGELVDHRTDLYALGILLYEMCTGAPPFTNDDPAAVLRMHVHKQPVSPARVVGRALPEPLEGLIMALLRKRPDERPPDAAAVIELLGRCASHPAISRRSHQRWEGAAPSPNTQPPAEERALPTLVSRPSELGIPVVPPGSVSDIDVAALRPVRVGRIIPAVLAIALVAVGLWWGPPEDAPAVPVAVEGAGVATASLVHPSLRAPIERAAAPEPAAPEIVSQPLSVPRDAELAEGRPRAEAVEEAPAPPETAREVGDELPESSPGIDGEAAATAQIAEEPPARPKRRRRHTDERPVEEPKHEGALAAAAVSEPAPEATEPAEEARPAPVAEQPEPPRIERWRPRSDP
jgi:serine/threonine-protein kinase